jgi:hypothetical protein
LVLRAAVKVGAFKSATRVDMTPRVRVKVMACIRVRIRVRVKG